MNLNFIEQFCNWLKSETALMATISNHKQLKG